ncbi:hypothetical protein CERSUDRAFT_87609 [Gelatoporia subvermispora B]|uniref:NadR/Ttd14 AAA domain-containing protein n=1 Tax=Ceriporiopsis subvermispora (strain B) TaxID=914234 RepID=M2QL73_CERS8|nr:hypothetical protein CERSUDRAFT_87609 [Gelatoporia subvermispora B]
MDDLISRTDTVINEQTLMRDSEHAVVQMDEKPSPDNSRCRTIFVVGASSTGKSTLCNALATTLGITQGRYIKEIARTVMREIGFTREHTDTYEMQYAIMAAQLAAEERVLQMPLEGDIIMLSDRSAIDPIVYAATSEVPGAAERERLLLGDGAFRAILPFYRRSLFVLLQPVIEWIVDDGVRSLEDPWRYNSALMKTLDGLEIPYVQIGEETKNIQARIEFVLSYLSRSLD